MLSPLEAITETYFDFAPYNEGVTGSRSRLTEADVILLCGLKQQWRCRATVKQAGRAGACGITALHCSQHCSAFPIIVSYAKYYQLNSCVKTNMLYISVIQAHHDFAG